MRASPPTLMAWEMRSMLPAATASRVRNSSMRRPKALPEFISEVCCERIVKTSSSAGSMRLACSKGP